MSSPRPIVHIGYHKTASTWFQKNVYPHATSHRYVSRLLVQQALLAPGALHFDAGAAREALRSDLPAILCEEGLSGYIHNGGLNGCLSKDAAERIRATFPDARIVMFVRAQPAIVTACYRQYVRGGGTHPVHRYLFPEDYVHGAAAKPWKAPRFSFDQFDYDVLVRHYRALFGAEAVHVFPYEALLADRDGFMRRFAAALELELDWDRVDHGRRNESWGAARMGAARMLNRFTARSVSDKRLWLHLPFLYTARGWALEQAGRLPERRLKPADVLGRDTVAWIEDRFWASNRRLAEMVDLDLARYRYPLDPPLSPAPRPRAGRWRRVLAQ